MDDFLYGAGPQGLTMVDASQNAIETDCSFDGRSLATVNSGGDYFAATDLLGTVRTRSNAGGSMIERDPSWPFGEFRNYGNTVSRIHYTGQLEDTESGLDYFGFRYYSSNLGRFLTPDPAGTAAADPNSPQSWNRYAYVGNMPQEATDPLGLDTSCGSAGGTYTCVDNVFANSQVTAGGCADEACWGEYSEWGTGPGGYPLNWGWPLGLDNAPPSGGGGGGAASLPTHPPGGGWFGKLLGRLKGWACSLLPMGRVESIGGGIGALGGETGSLSLVINYDSGMVSGFASGGIQAGWNGGASVALSTGFIFGNLGAGNSGFSGHACRSCERQAEPPRIECASKHWVFPQVW